MIAPRCATPKPWSERPTRWASRCWATAWAALDSGPVADLLRQSESGAPVQLTLCGERNAQGFHSAPRGLAQRIQGFFRPQRFMDLRNQL